MFLNEKMTIFIFHHIFPNFGNQFAKNKGLAMLGRLQKNRQNSFDLIINLSSYSSQLLFYFFFPLNTENRGR